MPTLLAPRLVGPALAALVCVAAPVAHAQVTLFGSTGYVTGGDLYANQATAHRATQTFAINSTSSTSTTRALTVAAGTHVNGGTLGGPGASTGSYSGTMPAVFAGFTAAASGSNISSNLTVRTQFQNGASGDFIHVNTYQESSTNTLAAGLNYRLAAALVFSAGQSISVGHLSTLAYATGATSYAANTSATHRVVVRDAATGTFYVSSASNFAATGSISLAASTWATLSTSNLATIGSYAAAPFTHFDHIGIYSDSSVTTTANLAGFSRVNGFTLSSLSYTAVPEPSSAAVLAGAIVLAGAATRRRRHARV